jgi:hypothetical protein
MDQATFAQRALASCERAVAFARQFVIQALPSQYALLVFPNSSCDFNLVDGEFVFPDESLPEDTYLGPMDVPGFVQHFWRNGNVPEWIDINVGGMTDDTTLLEVLVCGRFTANDDRLYHRESGSPPFHVVGPCLPPDWDRATPTRFDVNWLRTKRPLRPANPALQQTKAVVPSG